MAWIGTEKQVLALLERLEADRGVDGRFIVSGEPTVSGLGDELVVPDGTLYCRRGRPYSLARALELAGEGFAGFKVFETGGGYQANPIPKGSRKKVRDRTKRFDRELSKRLGKKETWRLSIRDAMPEYSVKVYIENCPGNGAVDRARTDVLEAFKASGLDKDLYFDGTDYGPLPGPGATAQTVAKLGCPERGYHFYDASPDHPAGLDANPGAVRHRAIYQDYLERAGAHIRAAGLLLDQGRFAQAFEPIQHAREDLSHAHTEAGYAKIDDKDLDHLLGPVEVLALQLQQHVGLMEESV